MSEFDTALTALAAVLALVAGYAGLYAYRAAPVIRAVQTFVSGLQTITTARADGVVTDTEERDVGRVAFRLYDEVADCTAVVRRP